MDLENEDGGVQRRVRSQQGCGGDAPGKIFSDLSTRNVIFTVFEALPSNTFDPSTNNIFLEIPKHAHKIFLVCVTRRISLVQEIIIHIPTY